MRAMFVIYLVGITAGLVYFTTIGLLHHQLVRRFLRENSLVRSDRPIRSRRRWTAATRRFLSALPCPAPLMSEDEPENHDHDQHEDHDPGNRNAGASGEREGHCCHLVLLLCSSTGWE
jgi:hypothetical protein